MGYMRHNAIIVTTWDKERLNKGLEQANALGLPVSDIVESPMNGYCSFLIAPDGSKEGWDTSNDGDEQRAAWTRWAEARPHLYLDWVHICYGGDEPELTHIVDHKVNHPEL